MPMLTIQKTGNCINQMTCVKSTNNYKNSLASVTLTEEAEQLKERLGAIMNFKKKTKLIAAVSFMAVVLLSIGGFAIGAYAAQPITREKRNQSISILAPCLVVKYGYNFFIT